MRFLKAVFIGVFLSVLMAQGTFYVYKPYDFNSDGLEEGLILNTESFSALWIERTLNGVYDTLWTYQLEDGYFSDGELIDINNDGFDDLVLIPRLQVAIENQIWLYVFLYNDGAFSNEPLTYKNSVTGINTIRPSNLTLNFVGNPNLAVSFGSPFRKAILFDLGIINKTIVLKNNEILSAPIIRNGNGPVYVGGFRNESKYYMALVSPQGSELKTAIFDVTNDNELLYSRAFSLQSARLLLGANIQPIESNEKKPSGLFLPFGSGENFLLSVVSDELIFEELDLTIKGSLPFAQQSEFKKTLGNKDSQGKTLLKVINSQNISYRNEAKALEPPIDNSNDKIATLKPVDIVYEKDVTSLPLGQEEPNINKTERMKVKKDYSMLAPTLGDFLSSIEDSNSNKKNVLEEKTSIPLFNDDMKSINWADEAGFTQLDLGEYVPDTSDTSSVPKIPGKDVEIATFTEEAITALNKKNETKDTLVTIDQHSGKIDLYYVMALTPVSETKDRYVFDGEAPFGVAVNQVPALGEPTHLQHGISADLATLKKGEAYDFAYSLRDARLDSITTLTMVHDMQTNVVFMSISPTDDSLSQSYQPESFDPKLFEFPNYFFEGFPTSLDMDFTDKLIRFSFKDKKDSTYQGIYLSSTTPSSPSQSLAVFLDEGTLQTVRGEVIVRDNGTKKVTTEYDLVGLVRPSVLFSMLIQEMFPEELKAKLLQGASLEEPLFGPTGKLPKITREPRLPNVQPDQIETAVPIEPKQSNVPIDKLDLLKTNVDSSFELPGAQENEASPTVLEVEKRKPNDSSLDTLKLEILKPEKSVKEENIPSAPEESQPEEEPNNTNKPKKE